jgi:hypothetical protein
MKDDTSSSSSVGDCESQVNLIATEAVEILPVTAKTIRQTSTKDKILAAVFRYTLHGWPSKLPKEDCRSVLSFCTQKL